MFSIRPFTDRGWKLFLGSTTKVAFLSCKKIDFVFIKGLKRRMYRKEERWRKTRQISECLINLKREAVFKKKIRTQTMF